MASELASNWAVRADADDGCVPEISRFFGIRISMYFDEHRPPHFHARYGEHTASIGIESLAVIAGHLPSRALGLVVEWGAMHRHELQADWDRARQAEPLQPIEPLR